MLTEKETTNLSKFLSLVLRHKPEEIGITLDEQGWVPVDELLGKLNTGKRHVTLQMLQHVVDTNAKKRFAFNDDQQKIRASQGHSVGVELGYEPQTPPDVLYHGTGSQSVDSIMQSGLEKRSRQHVHLSADKDTAINVGGRHGKPVVLTVAAAEMHKQGYHFYLSENKVWLTDAVPADFISIK
jgi:putative RNA 2'-phosphotransferase